ncbi:hypothetical protein ADUPG1_012222 [Aduncisulcus paluster]|uniref:Uncharacterized protein n=1 Tax=Aduncisulcus paluster TaxID=2918883 RepID=A0ABQ5K3H5_9EUKA|nr:hypothetical protein ADUPG1_012222 [Aduncisulcus paluster]
MDDPNCTERTLKLTNIFTSASTAAPIGSALTGTLLLDNYGPKITASLCVSIVTIGATIFSISLASAIASPNDFIDLFLPGFALIGLGSPATQVIMMQTSQLFPGSENVVMSAMSGAFGSSAITFQLIELFDRLDIVSASDGFWIYTCVVFICVVVGLVAWPHGRNGFGRLYVKLKEKDDILMASLEAEGLISPTEEEEERESQSQNDPSGCTTPIEEASVSCDNLTSGTVSPVPTTPRSSSFFVRHRLAFRQVFSWPFFGFILYGCADPLLFSVYTNNMTSIIRWSVGDDEDELNSLVLTFSIVQGFSVLCVLLGKMIDKRGLPFAFVACNVVLLVCKLSPIITVQTTVIIKNLFLTLEFIIKYSSKKLSSNISSGNPIFINNDNSLSYTSSPGTKLIIWQEILSMVCVSLAISGIFQQFSSMRGKGILVWDESLSLSLHDIHRHAICTLSDACELLIFFSSAETNTSSTSSLFRTPLSHPLVISHVSHSHSCAMCVAQCIEKVLLYGLPTKKDNGLAQKQRARLNKKMAQRSASLHDESLGISRNRSGFHSGDAHSSHPSTTSPITSDLLSSSSIESGDSSSFVSYKPSKHDLACSLALFSPSHLLQLFERVIQICERGMSPNTQDISDIVKYFVATRDSSQTKSPKESQHSITTQIQAQEESEKPDSSSSIYISILSQIVSQRWLCASDVSIIILRALSHPLSTQSIMFTPNVLSRLLKWCVSIVREGDDEECTDIGTIVSDSASKMDNMSEDCIVVDHCDLFAECDSRACETPKDTKTPLSSSLSVRISPLTIAVDVNRQRIRSSARGMLCALHANETFARMSGTTLHEATATLILRFEAPCEKKALEDLETHAFRSFLAAIESHSNLIIFKMNLSVSCLIVICFVILTQISCQLNNIPIIEELDAEIDSKETVLEDIVHQFINYDIEDWSDIDYMEVGKTAIFSTVGWLVPAILFMLAGCFGFCYCCFSCCCCGPNPEGYSVCKRNCTTGSLVTLICFAIVGVGLGTLITANMESLVNEGVIEFADDEIDDGIEMMNNVGTVAETFANDSDDVFNRAFNIVNGMIASLDSVLIQPWNVGAASKSDQLESLFHVMGGVVEAFVIGSASFGNLFQGMENPMFQIVGAGGFASIFAALKDILDSVTSTIDENLEDLCISSFIYELSDYLELGLEVPDCSVDGQYVTFYSLFDQVREKYNEDDEFRGIVDSLTSATDTTWANNLATTLASFLSLVTSTGSPLMEQMLVGSDYLDDLAESVVDKYIVSTLDDIGLVNADGNADLFQMLSDQYDLEKYNEDDEFRGIVDSLTSATDTTWANNLATTLASFLSLVTSTGSPLMEQMLVGSDYLDDLAESVVDKYIVSTLDDIGLVNADGNADLFQMLSDQYDLLGISFPGYTTLDEAMNTTYFAIDLAICLHLLFLVPAICLLCCRCNETCSGCCGCCTMCTGLCTFFFYFIFAILFIGLTVSFNTTCSAFEMVTDQNSELMQSIPLVMSKLQTAFEIPSEFLTVNTETDTAVLNLGSLLYNSTETAGDYLPAALEDYTYDITTIMINEFFGCTGPYTMIDAVNGWEFIGIFLGPDNHFPSSFISNPETSEPITLAITETIPSAITGVFNADMEGMLEDIATMLAGTSLSEFFEATFANLDTTFNNMLGAESDVCLAMADVYMDPGDYAYDPFLQAVIKNMNARTERIQTDYTSEYFLNTNGSALDGPDAGKIMMEILSNSLITTDLISYMTEAEDPYVAPCSNTAWDDALHDVCALMDSPSAQDAVSFKDTFVGAMSAQDENGNYIYLSQSLDSWIYQEAISDYCDETCGSEIAGDLEDIVYSFPGDATEAITALDPLLNVISEQVDSIIGAVSSDGALDTIMDNVEITQSAVENGLDSVWLANLESPLKAFASYFIAFVNNQFLSCDPTMPVPAFDLISTATHQSENFICGYIPNIFLSAALFYNFMLIAQVCLIYTGHVGGNRLTRPQKKKALPSNLTQGVPMVAPRMNPPTGPAMYPPIPGSTISPGGVFIPVSDFPPPAPPVMVTNPIVMATKFDGGAPAPSPISRPPPTLTLEPDTF